ncbi:MAG TPA: aminodeoxychorismate synthase component I [Ohtaekwangia sp.]|uniref:aminodeoxychorismate synthase component I n=1 Tax=Ohtaekwangia sp. TaxID=2066019 RepID=UPI002F954654
MTLPAFIDQMNQWGQAKVPFLFMVDFEMEYPVIIKLDEVDMSKILFNINGRTNALHEEKLSPTQIEALPVPLAEYKKKFDIVYDRLAYGDSFLTNLTLKTPITLQATLRELFYQSRAKYKVWMDEAFLVFSPETFVQIREGKIFSYPMKGTIDASHPHAREVILSDRKEEAEHTTIVDLIRNDLSQVATHVRVNRFRYIDELKTSNKNLLQVSSEIVGDLPDDYRSKLGDILVKLLPAGSVSGAPKQKTLEIIRKAEGEKRGYYTGVVGYFDGDHVDSGVMIRYIEKEHGTFFYRSGGGITTQSIVTSEYQEIIDKVYVPVD